MKDTPAKTLIRKRFWLFVRVILFVLLFFAVLLYLSDVMNTKWTKYEDFYQLEVDEIDYITLGSSHCLHSLNPLYIYAQTGVKGYNLADEAQSIAFSYYWLKEALKTQKPGLVFYDVGNLFYSDYYMVEDWKLKEYSAMRMSENKAACILDTAGNLESKIGGFFPLFYFHDRWKNLTAKDFLKENSFSDGVCGASVLFAVNGSSDPTIVNLFNKVDYGEPEGKYENVISEGNRQYFQKLVDLCRENGIQVIPTKFPTNSWDDARSESVEEFLAEYDLHLLDLNHRVLSMDWGTDSYDGGYHTNYWGSNKTSDVLGNYILERIETPDRMKEERWESLLASYCDYEKSSLLRGEDSRENCFIWLKDVYSDNTVILSINGGLSGNPDEIDSWLRMLGLSGYSDDHRNQSYIAVIEKGNVLFEKWDDRIMEYNTRLENDVPLRVYSSGNRSHLGSTAGMAQITVDGVSAAEGSQGLNIVVYDEESRSILASTTQYNAGSWSLEGPSSVLGDRYDLFSGRADWKLVSSQEADGSTEQSVQLQYEGNGVYSICREDGKYLTVSGANNQADSPVSWQKHTGLATQKWLFRYNFDDTYSVVSLYNHLYLGGSAVQLFVVEKSGEKAAVVIR